MKIEGIGTRIRDSDYRFCYVHGIQRIKITIKTMNEVRKSAFSLNPYFIPTPDLPKRNKNRTKTSLSAQYFHHPRATAHPIEIATLAKTAR